MKYIIIPILYLLGAILIILSLITSYLWMWLWHFKFKSKLDTIFFEQLLVNFMDWCVTEIKWLNFSL